MFLGQARLALVQLTYHGDAAVSLAPGPRHDLLHPCPLGTGRMPPSRGPRRWCRVPGRRRSGDLVPAEFLNPSVSTKDRISRTNLSKKRGGSLVHRPRRRVIRCIERNRRDRAGSANARQMSFDSGPSFPRAGANERVWMIRAYGGEVRTSCLDPALSASLIAWARGTGSRPWGVSPAPSSFTPDNAEAHRIFTGQRSSHPPLQIPRRGPRPSST